MDIKDVQKQFPVLSRKVNGKRLVYLDNSATTQKPKRVIDALSKFYEKHNANIHRGLHELSNESTEMYEESHELAADFIGAEGMEEIIFTRNTTESINLVAYGWGKKFLSTGDVVVLSEMEHHSNIVPWQMLVETNDIKIEWIPVDGNGRLDLEEYKKIFVRNRGKVKLVSVVHISNVLGTVNPIKKIADIAHENEALVLIDAAQSAARYKIDVNRLGIDFLAISSHKMYGPTGIGVLYSRDELLQQMDPWMGGGDMIRRVTKSEFSVNDLPWKFEAGTPNIADGAVFGEAIKFIQDFGFDQIIEHEKEIIKYAVDELKSIDGLKIYGINGFTDRMGAISFTIDEVHPHDLASIVNEEGVAIRAGHHCAMPLHIELGVPATARASFAVYNTKDDVDVLVNAIKQAKDIF